MNRAVSVVTWTLGGIWLVCVVAIVTRAMTPSCA
jgi:hypothetical protein